LSPEQRRDAVLGMVRATFKPEFLNRLDDLVIFDSLGPSELAHIVDLQLELLRGRLSDRRLNLDVTAAARDWLVRTGFDPLYGARPLRRLVQTAIGDQLARSILSGEVIDGATITFDVAPNDAELTLLATN
jgi:ATP-dependent Clp protease ATP-binding subunit ClpB